MTYDVGGQAVIEGVMMKSPNYYSVAIRDEKGKIRVQKKKFVSIVKTIKWLNIPIFRGVVYLFEMLILGFRTLTWSADQQTGEEEKLSNKELFFTLGISVVLSLLLFVGVPFFLASLIYEKGIGFNIIDGAFRLIVFLAYVIAIGFFDEVRRLYQYHGAEHKTVNCYEQGMKLTVRNVKKCSVQHPRCGTSFLVFVLFLSIVLFSFITSEVWYVKLLSRIVLIPLIAGVSYELLKASAKLRRHPVVRMFIYPGLMVQRLTTREPDAKQMEVAIKAMESVLALEKKVKT